MQFLCLANLSLAAIPRQTLLNRFSPTLNASAFESLNQLDVFSVGNGIIAVTCDVTGVLSTALELL
jgi:hypothetical protein